MSSPIEVLPVDPRVTEILADFPPDLFSADFYHSWELVDRYGREWILELADALGIGAALESSRTIADLRCHLGFVESFDHALGWLVRGLTEAGLARSEGSAQEVSYRLAEPLPPSQRLQIREACLAADPSNEPTLALLDAAARVYPSVARGETRGQEALFGFGQIQLWLDYFNNDNPIYAINNYLAAHVATQKLGPDAASILELGAGAGSGTEALIEALLKRGGELPIGYHCTEPSPFFRRRAERHLRATYPELALQFSAVDLDADLADQGILPGSCDLIYAVNVVHVARDLDRSLQSLRAALKPGGWLVAAESIRPIAGRTISTELVFQILEDFWDVQLDPVRRPTPGFLTPEQWTQLLEDNGFSAVEVIPDHLKIREVYGRFCTGVVCGQRSAERGTRDA